MASLYGRKRAIFSIISRRMMIKDQNIQYAALMYILHEEKGRHITNSQTVAHCCPLQNHLALPGFPTAITRSVTTSAKAAHPLLSFGRTQEPSKDKLIYSGPLSSLVRLVKFFSLSTSIISSGLLAALLMGGEGGAMTIVAGGISSVMICTPVILHWFTKGYITRLYYDYPSKTYTACTYDFFLTDAKTEFKRSDVSLPSVSNVISSFSIRGKPVLVDPRGFLNPNHYNHLMGYTDTEGNVTLEEAKKAFESASNDPESKS